MFYFRFFGFIVCLFFFVIFVGIVRVLVLFFRIRSLVLLYINFGFLYLYSFLLYIKGFYIQRFVVLCGRQFSVRVRFLNRIQLVRVDCMGRGARFGYLGIFGELLFFGCIWGFFELRSIEGVKFFIRECFLLFIFKSLDLEIVFGECCLRKVGFRFFQKFSKYFFMKFQLQRVVVLNFVLLQNRFFLNCY